MSETKKDVLAYVIIVFLLLGALFGMQIMSFIFGTLDPSVITSFTDKNEFVVNESGSAEEAGYTVAGASVLGFKGSVTVTEMLNATDGVLLPAANYTVNADTGLIVNGTAVNYDTVLITYNYIRDGDLQLTSEAIQNDSLAAIQTYSAASSTQFSTVSIAITLILLIGLFVIFWKLIMKDGLIGGNKGSGNFS